MHDPLDLRDMVSDELAEALISGRRVEAGLQHAVESAVESDDAARLAPLYDELARLPLVEGWAFDEDLSADDIERLLRSQLAAENGPSVVQPGQIRGAWEGRILGCAIGKPVEGSSKEEIARYVEFAGWDLDEGFIPWVRDVPEGIRRLNDSAPVSTRGNVFEGPRDDDLDYTVLGLHMLEQYGASLSQEAVAHEWLDKLPYLRVYTAERVTYRNLISGHAPSAASSVMNPYREWIGALIRADIYGYVNPGRLARAALLALEDARLSHTGNGITGACWSAALLSLCLSTRDVSEAVRRSIAVVPDRTRLRAALVRTIELYDEGASWQDFGEWLHTEFAGYSWVHTNSNAALIAGSLLWGEGEFVRSVAMCVAEGLDTDSSAATVGSALGAVHGSDGLPRALVAQFHGKLRSEVRGYDTVEIADLERRTEAVRVGLLSS